MITRSQGREWTLQMLVQFDINSPPDVDDAISAFWDQQSALERESLDNGDFGAKKVFSTSKKRELAALAEIKEFAECRIRGAWADRDKLDAAVTPFLEHWSMYRLGTVERNVLRLGAWELMNCSDIPAEIVINEAVDLVKYFSENKSGRIVNAVLDKLAKRLKTEGGARGGE